LDLEDDQFISLKRRGNSRDSGQDQETEDRSFYPEISHGAFQADVMISPARRPVKESELSG
jgi:hypothetical protein